METGEGEFCVKAMVHDSRGNEDSTDGNCFEAIVSHRFIVEGGKLEYIGIQAIEELFLFY